MRGLDLGFTNPGGTWRKWYMCPFWLRWCGWCWGGVCGLLRPGSGRVCFFIMFVCVVSLDSLC